MTVWVVRCRTSRGEHVWTQVYASWDEVRSDCDGAPLEPPSPDEAWWDVPEHNERWVPKSTRVECIAELLVVKGG